MLEADESELIEKLRRRDEAAFSAFVLRYQERVFRLLLRMLGDRAEAEDLAQEVFISIFKAIEGFRGESQLSTWVYRVAANHCRNRIKYLARRRRQAARGVRRKRGRQWDDSPRPAGRCHFLRRRRQRRWHWGQP